MRRYLLLAVLAVAACDEEPTAPDEVLTTEYIAVRRPWAPGERDSTIAAIRASQQLVFPFIGNMSDYADAFLPVDSAVSIIANPALDPRLVSPFGPSYAVGRLMVPGTGWTAAVVVAKAVDNTVVPADSNRYLGVFWYNNADNTQKGFIFAGTNATSVSNVVVNTAAFDAADHKSGAGGGEAWGSFPGSTYWEAIGLGTPNTISVGTPILGGTSTVTSGPYLGGTRRTGLSGSYNLNNIIIVRQFGSLGPVRDTISFSGGAFSIGATELVCRFPTPCTTNALRAMATAGEARRPHAAGRHGTR